MARVLKLNMTIRKEGDQWRIVGLGVSDCPDHPNMVFCHLASATRFRQQRNGAVPIQICTWVKGQISN